MSPETEKRPAPPQTQCPHCQALVAPTDKLCWLCHSPLLATNFGEVIMAELVEDQSARQRWQRTIGTIVVAVLAVLSGLVLIGVAQKDPLNMIPVGLLMIPILLVAIIANYQIRGSQASLGWLDLILKIALSLAIVMTVVSILIVVAVIAFFIYCLTQLGSLSGH